MTVVPVSTQRTVQSDYYILPNVFIYRYKQNVIEFTLELFCIFFVSTVILHTYLSLEKFIITLFNCCYKNKIKVVISLTTLSISMVFTNKQIENKISSTRCERNKQLNNYCESAHKRACQNGYIIICTKTWVLTVILVHLRQWLTVLQLEYAADRCSETSSSHRRQGSAWTLILKYDEKGAKRGKRKLLHV